MSVRKYTSRPTSCAYSHIGPNAVPHRVRPGDVRVVGVVDLVPSPTPEKVRYSMKPGMAIAL